MLVNPWGNQKHLNEIVNLSMQTEQENPSHVKTGLLGYLGS